ncbi:MAG: type III pantothenate kinase [Spirochaetota bacterium]|nr:type III pantothenate kinase [Spirochaetota bacterium]
MLLAIDVGNSSIEFGIFKIADQHINNILYNFRIPTNKDISDVELGKLITFNLLERNINPKLIKNVISASVVTSLDHTIYLMCENNFHCKPLVISYQLNTGLTFNYPNPQEIGADRIVNAVAANELFGGPAIIVDFGTATTFCAITKNSEYLGGVIAPGLNTSLNSLIDKTDKLNKVNIIKPQTILAKSTAHAIQSGIYFGAIGSFEYIINQIKNELSFQNAKIITTGGFSKFIAQGTQIIDILDPFLTLKGLKILFHKNNLHLNK